MYAKCEVLFVFHFFLTTITQVLVFVVWVHSSHFLLVTGFSPRTHLFFFLRLNIMKQMICFLSYHCQSVMLLSFSEAAAGKEVPSFLGTNEYCLQRDRKTCFCLWDTKLCLLCLIEYLVINKFVKGNNILSTLQYYFFYIKLKRASGYNSIMLRNNCLYWNIHILTQVFD